MCCVLRGLRYFEATIQASFNRALNMATDKEKKLVRKKPEKSRLKDPEYQRLPSLRISHIVYGRELRGNRVYYLVDPKGGGTNKKVAESVVLYRWRRGSSLVLHSAAHGSALIYGEPYPRYLVKIPKAGFDSLSMTLKQ